MRHSLEKRRDMARSILPSKHRHASRAALAATRRAARRSYRQRLAYAASDPGHDELFDAIDIDEYPDQQIRMVVYRRRGADKLNHFEHWAIRVTRELPIEDRLSYLRAILPSGLIGEHAMSHLDWLEELSPTGRLRWWTDPADWHRRQEALRARLVDQVRKSLEDGRHAELNRAMKRYPIGTPPVTRTLAGVHDVDAFVDDVMAVNWWRRALSAYFGRPARPYAQASALS